MSSISLTPTQHAVLAHAIEHAEGRIEWFPPTVNGGARQKGVCNLNCVTAP